MTNQTTGARTAILLAMTILGTAGIAVAAGPGNGTGKSKPPKNGLPPAPTPAYAPPPKVAAPPTPAPSPTPGAGTSSTGGAGRAFGSSGSGRPVGSVGEGRPVGSVGEGRPVGSVGAGRPFGAIGRPAETGPLTVPTPDPELPYPPDHPDHPDHPGHPDHPMLPEGGYPPHRNLVPNPYVVLPPPSSLTITPAPESSSGTTVAPPAPVPAAPEVASQAAPTLAPTQAEIRLATTLAERGREQLETGQDQLAEVTLFGAVRLFPDDPVLRLDHAFALIGSGYTHAAAAELLRGLQLDPDLADLTLNVVAPFGSRESFDERLEVVDQYSSAYPLDSHSRFLRAFLAFHLNDIERARADFDALYRADPEFPFVRLFRTRLRSFAPEPPPPPPLSPQPDGSDLEPSADEDERSTGGPDGGAPPQ